MLRWLVLAAAGLGSAAIAYARVVRPWHIRWGATDDEVARAMPLDERIPAPSSMSTRAITIHARPDQIWPWLAQMGDAPRGGYYSYAWIERLMGMQIDSPQTVLAQYQELNVGDPLDKAGTMTVLAVDRSRYLVLGPPESLTWMRATWAFHIFPMDGDSSRLVTRVRAEWSYLGMLRNTPPPLWVAWLFIDPGVFIMERKMLIEIKRRAEGLAANATIGCGVS